MTKDTKEDKFLKNKFATPLGGMTYQRLNAIIKILKMAKEENLLLGLQIPCSLSVSVLKAFKAQVKFANVFQVKIYKY